MIKNIQAWIDTFVSQYNENLETVPCPYAKHAKIKYLQSTSIEKDLECIFSSWQDDVEVVCVYFDHNTIASEELDSIVEKFNDYAMQGDIVALQDHPEAVESINNVVMNFGQCGLILVQRLSKINHASLILEKKGYYKHWSKENLDDVVTWRKNGI